MADYSHKIVIVGTGVSGLSAGIYLKKKGYQNITFIEASDRVGGRMKTDIVDGYTLDRGFHTYFTAYPYASEILDLDELDLKFLNSGALVLNNRKLKKYIDPFKNPLSSLKMLFSDIGKWNDKLNLIKRRAEAKQISENQIFEKFEVKTSSILKKKHFSNQIIKNFFNPLFSSIFLDNELKTSRRVFDYTFKMLMEGRAAIPAKGIESIPKQMAAHFDKNNFIFNNPVVDIKDQVVYLQNGDTISADITLIATDHNTFYAKYKKEPLSVNHKSTTCLYFSADSKPFKEPMVCVNANEPKFVNSVVVLTNIDKQFAPVGKELISVNINGLSKVKDDVIENVVKDELSKYFGMEIFNWKLLKVYKIDYALPNQEFVLGKRKIADMKLGEQVYVCGDHLLYGSMNAAIKTGKMVAEIIHRDFNPGHKIELKKKYDSLFTEANN
jgi:protoporphyrinogen oxidase